MFAVFTKENWLGHWLFKSCPKGNLVAIVWHYRPSNLLADMGYLYKGAVSHPDMARLAAESGCTGLRRFADIEEMRKHYQANIEDGMKKFDLNTAPLEPALARSPSERKWELKRFMTGEYQIRVNTRAYEQERDQERECELAEVAALIEEMERNGRGGSWVGDYYEYIGNDREDGNFDWGTYSDNV